ncbi:Uncharacterized protein FWK35_00034974, partial [Aphis craccivora]
SRNNECTTKASIIPSRDRRYPKNIARQLLGYTYIDQGFRLKSLIDENTIGQMVENKLQKMWGCLLNTGLNISLLYQTFGWSLKMLAGIFTYLTQFIMHEQHENEFKENTNDNKTHKKDIKLQLQQHQNALVKPKNNSPISPQDIPEVKYV